MTVVSGVVLDGVISLISLKTAAMVECLYAVWMVQSELAWWSHCMLDGGHHSPASFI